MFDTDFTSPGFNAYVDIATITPAVEFLERINGSIGWEAMPVADKEAQIVNSSFSLANIEFSGVLNPLVVTNNPMHFPRSGLFYKNGNAVPEDQIPNEINNYVACYLFEWISNNRSTTGSSSIGMVRKKKVDDVEIEFETGSSIAEVTVDGSDLCMASYIPEDWVYKTETSILGVGSVGKMRAP
jgi:hypothetical protein